MADEEQYLAQPAPAAVPQEMTMPMLYRKMFNQSFNNKKQQTISRYNYPYSLLFMLLYWSVLYMYTRDV